MALSQTEILTVAGVLVLLFAVILTNNFRAAKATRALKVTQASADVAPTNKPWLGRYLQNEGDIVGQVVAVEAERVIVRKGALNLAIAKSQVREQGADLGVVGTLDLAAAEKAGAEWKAP